MDDWFTIVLAFLFIVLPILEGIFKKSKKGAPPAEGAETVSRRDSLPSPRRVEPARPGGPEVGASQDSSWSDGWGSWPGEEEDDEEQAEEPVPAWGEPVSGERSQATHRPFDFPPAPVEVARRVPDLIEVPQVGRSSELQRLQEQAARLDRVAREVTQAPVPAPARRVTSSPKPRRVSRPAVGLLNDRAGVRQALIVSEVLGPPLSIRDRPQV